MIEIAIVYCCTVMCFSAVIYKSSAKYKKLRCNKKEKNISNTVSKEQMIWIVNELRI